MAFLTNFSLSLSQSKDNYMGDTGKQVNQHIELMIILSLFLP